MTPDPQRLAYDDMATPAEMHADCEQVGLRLKPPSIRFEDYPTDLPKPEIRITEAAQRIANALELHLD